MISVEIRKLIVAARKDGMQIKEIEKAYHVKKSSIYNFLNLVQETGDVIPRTCNCGRKPALDEDGLKHLENLLQEQPDITLEEIKEKLDLPIGITAISTIITRKLHYRFKKRRYMPVNVTARTCRKREYCGKSSNRK
jgi:transposase